MLDTLRGIFRIFHLNRHSNCVFTQKVVILNFVPKFFQKISDHPPLIYGTDPIENEAKENALKI